MPDITLHNSTCELGVSPEKGAVVTRFLVKGVPVLFEDTIVNTAAGQKRRGGIPLLFPCAGPLSPNDVIQLPQHGFARDKAWSVLSQTQDFVSLQLNSDEQSIAQFPFCFELTINLQLEESALSYELEIQNMDSKPMPVAPGLHPYFYVPLAQRRAISTSILGFTPMDYQDGETLSFNFPSLLTITVPDYGCIKLTASDEFKKLMIWSEAEQNYICFEPWRGEVGALLDPRQCLLIPAGQTIALSMRISFEPTGE